MLGVNNTANSRMQASNSKGGGASPTGKLSVQVKKHDMSSFMERIPSDSLKAGGEEQKQMQNNDSSFFQQQSEANWYELRLVGKYPERRGYHASFVHNRKYASLCPLY